MKLDPSLVSAEELLSVLEASFRAGLQEIRRIRAAREPENTLGITKKQRKDRPVSRTANAIDILTQSPRPMHIHEILEALEARNLPSSRESLVSALTKQIAPLGPVIRVAPNTFTVKGC